MGKKTSFLIAGLLVAVALVVAMNLLPYNQWMDWFRGLLKDAGSGDMLLFVVVGTLKIRFWPYLLSSLIGMIPGTLLSVYAGSVALSLLGDGKGVSFWQWFLFAVGLLLFAAISWRVTRKTQNILQKSAGDKSIDKAR